MQKTAICTLMLHSKPETESLIICPPTGLERFNPAFYVSQMALDKDNGGGLFNRCKNSTPGDDLLVGRILQELGAWGGLKVFDAEYRVVPGRAAAANFSPFILQFQKEAGRFSR